MSVNTNNKLYEGKAKIIYTTEDPQVLLAEFKDDATAFNAKKRGSIQGKGSINCAISTKLFLRMAQEGIENHFIDSPGATQMRVKALKNFALGSSGEKYCSWESLSADGIRVRHSIGKTSSGILL